MTFFDTPRPNWSPLQGNDIAYRDMAKSFRESQRWQLPPQHDDSLFPPRVLRFNLVFCEQML